MKNTFGDEAFPCPFTAMFLCPNLNIKIAKTWTLFSNNVNTTIRKYASRAFVWVVTPLDFVGRFRIYSLVKFAFRSEGG